MVWSQVINEKTLDGFMICQKTYAYTINLRFINRNCVECGICEILCPKTAIKLVKDNKIQIDENKCVRCGICSYLCMFNALQIKYVSFDNIKKKEVEMKKIGGLPNLKSKITINYKKCNLCQTCEKVCPKEAISINENQLEIKDELCILCGWCSSTCPEGAITVDKLFQGSLLLKKNIDDNNEIQELISICPSKCLRYKDMDSNRIRNVKTKKILGKDSDNISWLNEFCIFCGACVKLKPEFIIEFKRTKINSDVPFLENKIWVEIKKKLLNR
ncbi:MAG: 4Fe-4S dicluster domain-containing protein [Candidatus Lokiarchaeota archaeon]|nr:4Fe-4S dicluster domain-containing protein [Candidatus Lokiarchaeota archaeon]